MAMALEQLPSLPRRRQQRQQQRQQQVRTKAIDVYGQQTEAICTYSTCDHKLSVHGYRNHKCRCRHPVNRATGVSVSISL